MPLKIPPQLADIFSDTGTLAKALPGFRARSQQLEMASAVSHAINERSSLVVEAGTGTGKTYAYLVPALISGAKVIVSTGTKTLQDQLFQRDVPALKKALSVPVSVAILKGRANYVCRYHLEQNASDTRFTSRDEARYFRLIERFVNRTQRGDKSELSEVPDDSPVWLRATSTRDNCLGQDCPQHKDCFLMAARREAMAADVVIVNHHLFFADVMLRDESLAELLPQCNTVIFDEAHQLPDTATAFFGERIGTGQLAEWLRDAEVELRTGAPEAADALDALTALAQAQREFRLALALALPNTFGGGTKVPAESVTSQPEVLESLRSLLGEMLKARETLTLHEVRSEGLGNIARRIRELHLILTRWSEPAVALAPEEALALAPTSAPEPSNEPAPESTPSSTAATDAAAIEDRQTPRIRWLELSNHGFQLHSTPLSVAPMMRKHMSGNTRAWIFTSATLSVNGDFRHYCADMGLDTASTETWASPFNYFDQAVLCVPDGTPQPNSPAHTEAVVDMSLPLIQATGGGVFMLFTSLRALGLAAQRLRDAFERDGQDFPLLVQGEGSRSELLSRFRSHGNAVLLGAASFWEGVDVQGDALSLVIIDKIPFAPPDDPVLAAQMKDLQARGGNPFASIQLPNAAIALKQGAGRLIRSENDRGALVIFDPRLIEKSYGAMLCKALPPMRKTRNVVAVERFLKSLKAVP